MISLKQIVLYVKMASNSYKKYNDLGMTASEKAAENAMHMQMTQHQETIRKQQEQIAQLQKKQSTLSRAISANSKRPPPLNKASVPASYNRSHAPRVRTIQEKKNAIISNKIAIFKISAPWCQPCQEMAPKYNALAKLVNSSGKIMLYTEEHEDRLSADVQHIPAIDFYFRSKKVHRQTGADFNETKKYVNMLINSAKSEDVRQQQNNMQPHPAQGMQPERSRNNRPESGRYPPSTMRM
tara:strand:+ start:1925 stop:2641 length:717 start_codon:yes stop_codon:yes gene_type:complete